MPRPKKDTPEPPNSLVASAAQITSRRKRGKPQGQGALAWQTDAWDMLDQVGELEFYREWIANALSRVTLHVTREKDNGDRERVTEGLAVDALSALFGGEQGQSQMLASMAGHLAIPGETWLVGLLEASDDPDGPDMWRVVSRDEIKQDNGKVTIDRGDGEPESYSEGRGQPGEDGYEPPQVYVTRIWRPHPRKWVEAHSSVRSALPILRELLGLTKKVGADIDSRLAGAGILIMPQEATFTSPIPSQDPTDPQVDPLLAAITEAMTTAIRDRGDVSATAPIIVRVPAQYVEHVKHITFWSEFSGEARELRQEALKRLANSLDVPAEVLLGLADVNHWTGWLLDENAVKMHVEPLVELICHGLSTRYLHAILANPSQPGSMSIADARTYAIEGDTSALRQRPNRSAEAQEMHNAMVITDAALARERGFEPSDLLSDPANAQEFKRRLLQKAAQGVQTADVTVAALAQLGVTLVPKPSEVQQTSGGTTAEQVPTPPPPAVEAPRQDPPQQPDAPPATAALAQAKLTALALSAEGDVLRAVERAWNRAGKRRGGDRRPVPADQLDACLVGAWHRVERIAAMTGVDQDRLRRALDAYTRQLLITGAEYDPPAFAVMLRDRVLADTPEAIGA